MTMSHDEEKYKKHTYTRDFGVKDQCQYRVRLEAARGLKT